MVKLGKFGGVGGTGEEKFDMVERSREDGLVGKQIDENLNAAV